MDVDKLYSDHIARTRQHGMKLMAESDRDYREANGDPDPDVQEMRLEEAERELRWSEFVYDAKRFAESEGWPCVFAALSRAMRETEQEGK